MYGMYGTVSATVRYSTVYGTVHRKWSEVRQYGIFPSTRREKDNTGYTPMDKFSGLFLG